MAACAGHVVLAVHATQHDELEVAVPAVPHPRLAALLQAAARAGKKGRQEKLMVSCK
jgi:prephenate dehydrogenase